MKTLSSLLVTVLLLLVTAGSAYAATSAELLRHVPTSSPMVVGIEMPKVTGTHLYDQGMKFLKASAVEGSLLSFVLSKKAFDLDKEIESVVVAFATAPTDPRQPPPATMAAVAGTFDAVRVRTAIEERFGKVKSRKTGALEIFATGGVEFAFPTPSTLVITEIAYAAPTWKGVADEKAAASTNKEIQGLLQLTDTTRGVWLAMNTRAVPTPAGALPMDGAGISIDLRAGLALDFRSQFAKAADAATAKKQAEDLQKSTDDPLIEMLGATPLVKNLVATQNERVLILNTSMTDAEVRVMLARLKAMNEAPPPVAPAGEQPAATGTPPPTQPGKGTKADFN